MVCEDGRMKLMKILTYGIYLIVFCLPLYLIRFKVFGIPTTVLELMIYALFIAWAIKNLKSLSLKIKDFNLLFAIVLILVGVSLTTIFSSELRMSAGIWKAWFIDPILFFIVLVSVIKNSEQIKKVLFSLFLSGTIVSVISLIYLILGKLDPVDRLQAFYNSPNYLAMYLAPVLIIGLGFLMNFYRSDYSHEDTLDAPAWRLARPRLARSPKATTMLVRLRMVFLASNLRFSTFFLFSIFFFLFSIFFTHSYGAWLGIITAVGFGLVFYLFKLNRKNSAWIIFVLALIIILFLGYFALTQRQTSFDARLIIWQKTWEVFKAHPIFGIGPGTFGNYFSAYPELGSALSAPKPALSAGVPQPHNIFLAFLLQTGIIGFIGFIWLLCQFFRAGIKNLEHRIENQELRIMNIVLMMIMMYILVHGLVDTTYWKNDLSVIFWFVVGLMVVLKIKKLEFD